MYDDLKKLNDELSKKKVNILYKNNHIIFKRPKFCGNEQKVVLDDLSDFLSFELCDFEKYEKWLEASVEGDKKR